MPYTKILPVRSAKNLSSKLGYVCSVLHRNHKSKVIEVDYFHGVSGKTEFLAKTVSTVREIKARYRGGRRLKIFADEVIIRTPDNTNLSTEERKLFVERILQDCFPRSPAVSAWHIDRYSGAADLHLLIANFTDLYPPKPRRNAIYNPLLKVRNASDRITDDLNRARVETGVAPIVTMREVKLQKLKASGLVSLEDRLAALSPFSVEDLPDKIAELGFEVTRFSPLGNSISVKFDKAKKARRYPISSLLSFVKSHRGSASATGDSVSVGNHAVVPSLE